MLLYYKLIIFKNIESECPILQFLFIIGKIIESSFPAIQ